MVIIYWQYGEGGINIQNTSSDFKVINLFKLQEDLDILEVSSICFVLSE